MNEKELKELLGKYLTGELSGMEQARLESWFAEKQRTGRDLFVEKAAGDINKDNSTVSGQSAFEKDLFGNILSELGFQARSPRRKWLRVAASILIIMGLGAVGYKYYSERGNSTVNKQVVENTGGAAADSASWKTIVNTGAATRKLVMTDGSKVSLYQGSELRFDSAMYNTLDRKLYLSGKGFFDVARETSKPFIVYSRGISTMALGTAFIIDGYGKNKKIKIDLVRGKVRIRKELKAGSAADNRADFKDIILHAGQYFAYDFALGKSTRGQLSDHIASGTKKAIKEENKSSLKKVASSPLIYDRAALSKVIEDMESAYQIHIDYNKEEMNAIQFSGSITPDDSVQHILKKIGLLNDLQITEMEEGRFKIDKMKN